MVSRKLEGGMFNDCEMHRESVDESCKCFFSYVQDQKNQ